MPPALRGAMTLNINYIAVKIEHRFLSITLAKATSFAVTSPASCVVSSTVGFVINIKPFGMMIHFLNLHRAARHKSKRIPEIGKFKLLADLFVRVRPPLFGEIGE